MKFAAIQSALAEMYTAGGFGLQTFWPSVDYTPQAGQPHAQIAFITNQPEASSVGTGGLDVHTGILQIDLMYPLGKGTGDSVEKADQVANVFKGGTQASFGGQTVNIRSCGIRQPTASGGWLRTIISIAWIAYVARE